MGCGFSEKRLDVLEANRQRCDYVKRYFSAYYDTAISIYMGTCMYDNIKENLKYKNKGNIFNYVKGKQAFWMKLYLTFPKLTCLLRNCLNVGM